ncbi:MAG: chromosome condensation regulator RCC1, partial [Planctomycetota bacterium]|nr:chromosome condensation regulator RCC1 [Planctomycetota bacterium]
TPVSITSAVTTWRQISAGKDFGHGIRSDGTLWGWGNNTTHGMVGNDSTTDQTTPVQIATGITWTGLAWKQVSGGHNHGAAVTLDGKLYAWGNNAYGQVGDSTTTTPRLVPTQECTAATDWKSCAAGYRYTAAIKTNGTLWAWGDGADGRLGRGTTVDSSVPVRETTNGTNWKQVSCGSDLYAHTAAVKTNGTLWTWGDDTNGKLGNGAPTADVLTPTQIATGITNWKQVSCGNQHTAAVTLDGKLYTWGDNAFGQLGDDTLADQASPVQVGSDTDWNMVSSGYNHTIAVKNNGDIYVWGNSSTGELGIGTRLKTSPVQVGTAMDWAQASAGDDYTAAVKTTGQLWAWGDNTYGRLGNGSTADRGLPVRIGSDTNWQYVDCGSDLAYCHTVATRTAGTLWAWGDGGQGQLGRGTTTDSSVPVQESTLATTWASCSAGSSFSHAVKTDGTLWGWGDNTTKGMVGNDSTTDVLTPTQIAAGITNWKQVSSGYNHGAAVTLDGKLYAWGDGSQGQLGRGTTADSLVPVQESTGATNWAQVSCGNRFTHAIKTDGTLWGWGDNTTNKMVGNN